MAHSTFELFVDKAGEYRFRLKAGNGEIMLISVGHTSRESVVNAIISVCLNAKLEERFERRNTMRGYPTFNIVATNGQVIGIGETYSSVMARDNAIKWVMENAPKSGIRDYINRE